MALLGASYLLDEDLEVHLASSPMDQCHEASFPLLQEGLVSCLVSCQASCQQVVGLPSFAYLLVSVLLCLALEILVLHLALEHYLEFQE